MHRDGETLIILTPGFPKNEADTTCLPFLQTHVEALNKQFPELEVIIIAFQYPFVKQVYDWRGNEVIALGGRERPKIHRLKIWLQVWRKLRELKRSKNVIGLFSLWCTECALLGSYFGKMNRLKHYTWLCGQDAKAGNKYVKYTRPHKNELIAMSDFLKREFFKNYTIEPAYVIPIGVDPDQFSTPATERNIDILGAGSLIPLKQYDVFVDVIGELTKSMPELKVILCGHGPERERIEKQAVDLQVSKNIVIKGEVPHTDVLQYMQQAKIFLHTSNYEGFGAVCLEALYAGAHVVSFTKPMDAEIPHWHHVSNKEAMVVKLKELLCDPDIIYSPVIPYNSNGTAIAIMQLFGN